jgi:hypothetical protein
VQTGVLGEPADQRIDLPAYRPGLWYFAGANGGVHTTTAFTDGQMGGTPLPVYRPTAFDRVGVAITGATAGSTLRTGLYADEEGLPGTLLVEFASVTLASGGQTIAISTDLPLDAGHYWLALVSQGASTTFRTMTATVWPTPILSPNWTDASTAPYTASDVSAALPSVFPISTFGLHYPRFIVRVAP